MRRKDREITQRAQLLRVIEACDCCRVGFCTEDGVYIVPLNFGFEAGGDGDVLYFHGAKEGRKAELASQKPKVGFEMDAKHRLKEGELPCKYSFFYESVIGTGTIAPVEELTEKKRALSVIMAHYAPEKTWAFTDAQAGSIAVFRLDIAQMSGKKNAPIAP